MSPIERYFHDPEFHHLVKIIRDELRSLKGTDPVLVDDWALCVASAVSPLDSHVEAMLEDRRSLEELLRRASNAAFEPMPAPPGCLR